MRAWRRYLLVEVGEVSGVIVPDTSAALFGIASDAYWTPSIVEIATAAIGPIITMSTLVSLLRRQGHGDVPGA